jgi:hypothetical protein
MAPLQDVRELLASIETPGTFATRRTSAADNLWLDVKGVGRITWPIASTMARRLCAIARPAGYGLKTETRFDPRVRDTWEIPKSRIKIDEPRWGKTLRPLLERLRRDLGLSDGSHLKAKLHNMLVYGPGQFFATHRDSEKTDGMIGTLVVILPSDFTGGAIEVEHGDKRITFRGHGRKLTFIAFYADCHHQVRPVRAGHRIVLTYNLVVEGDGPTAALPVPSAQVDALAGSITRYFETLRPPRWSEDPRREAPDRLAYLLDHQYTRRGLAWSRLKNADAARVAALREVAQRLDCEIFLALAAVHESWSCDDEEGMYGYGRRRVWAGEYDDEAEDGDVEDDEGSETPTLVELLDTDIELRHWIALDGRMDAVSGTVDVDEVCDTKASNDFEPFASEHEGYMGNYGNTVDRWYHRAAVVLWPRERTFVIRAKASPRSAIDELTKTLRRGDVEGARGMAQRLAPFWKQVANREQSRSFLERTLLVAGRLDSPELAADLLQPFTLERLTPKAAPKLVALSQRYGIAWCQAVLRTWASEGRRDHSSQKDRAAWMASLPSLCQQLCADGSGPAYDLARWLVMEEWTRVGQEWQRLREHPNPTIMLDAVCGISTTILALLESSLIANSRDLHSEMLSVLTSPDTEYPIRGLTHLLRTAHEAWTGNGLRNIGLAPLREHCAQTLTALLRTPAREQSNWSIPSPRRCTCGLCGTLTRFLVASDQTRLEWPLVKDSRAHVHQILDAHGLPVTHTTRRAGRPFTLVLMKTDALFERETKEREVWERDLLWLTRTARAF